MPLKNNQNPISHNHNNKRQNVQSFIHSLEGQKEKEIISQAIEIEIEFEFLGNLLIW